METVFEHGKGLESRLVVAAEDGIYKEMKKDNMLTCKTLKWRMKHYETFSVGKSWKFYETNDDFQVLKLARPMCKGVKWSVIFVISSWTFPFLVETRWVY